MTKAPLMFLTMLSFLTLHRQETAHAFSTSPYFADNQAAAATTTEHPLAPHSLSFPNLDASRIRHPLDRNLTQLVEKLPGMRLAEQGIRRVLPIVEQGLRLDLLTTSIKVSPQQLPHVHKLLVEACTILDLPILPQVYVQSNAQANAYTLAFSNDDNNNNNNTPPILVVTSALLDQCTDRELLAVIGHELGHVKCQHSLYLTLGQLAATPWRGIPLVGAQMTAALQHWRKSAEYSCDRAALLVVQNVTTVQTALIKLVAGTNGYPLDVESFLAQCMNTNRSSLRPIPWSRPRCDNKSRLGLIHCPYFGFSN
jgi:hypothetical protein